MGVPPHCNRGIHMWQFAEPASPHRELGDSVSVDWNGIVGHSTCEGTWCYRADISCSTEHISAVAHATEATGPLGTVRETRVRETRGACEGELD